MSCTEAKGEGHPVEGSHGSNKGEDSVVHWYQLGNEASILCPVYQDQCINEPSDL